MFPEASPKRERDKALRAVASRQRTDRRNWQDSPGLPSSSARAAAKSVSFIIFPKTPAIRLSLNNLWELRRVATLAASPPGSGAVSIRGARLVTHKVARDRRRPIGPGFRRARRSTDNDRRSDYKWAWIGDKVVDDLPFDLAIIRLDRLVRRRQHRLQLGQQSRQTTTDISLFGAQYSEPVRHHGWEASVEGGYCWQRSPTTVFVTCLEARYDFPREHSGQTPTNIPLTTIYNQTNVDPLLIGPHFGYLTDTNHTMLYAAGGLAVGESAETLPPPVSVEHPPQSWQQMGGRLVCWCRHRAHD